MYGYNHNIGIGKIELKIRPIQSKILEKTIYTDRVNIFAGMGSGKTIATLVDMVVKQSLNGDVFPALIIAPLQVARGVWQNELQKYKEFEHLTFSTIIGTVKQKEKAIQQKADIYITNYESVAFIIKYLLIQNRDKSELMNKFNTVVCDESNKIKNHTVRVDRTCEKLRLLTSHKKLKHSEAVVILSQYVRYWYNLSGTPAANGLVDLWGVQFPIDFGEALGRNKSDFIARYGIPKVVSHPEWGYTVPHSLKNTLLDKISNNTVVVMAEDFYGLDKPIESDIQVVLSDELMQRYRYLKKALVNEALMEENKVLKSASAATILMKLREFASGFYIDTETLETTRIHTAKLDALFSYLEEYKDERILIWYHFNEDRDLLLKHLSPLGETALISERNIERWNNLQIKYLLANPQSAGHGLNLQHGGNRMLFYTPDYNADTREQAIARLGVVRQFQSGHNRPVFVDNLVVKNTVEELVLNIVREKKDVMRGVIEYLQN